MDEAKQACKEDKNCSGIYDVDCGDEAGSIIHLCTDVTGVASDVSCVHEKIIVGNTITNRLKI